MASVLVRSLWRSWRVGLPLEGRGDLLVAAAEGEEVLLEGVEVWEVVGGDDLALDHGEVDLGLVEPAGVDRGVDDVQVWPAALEAVDRAFAAVRGAVVDDQEDALGAAVGVLRHELLDERVERHDPVLGGAAVEDLGAPCVPGGEVAECALALVLVLDLLAGAGPRRPAGGDPLACLDRGLLVGADDVVAGMEALSLPGAGVEVEDRAGARRRAGRGGRSRSGAARA